MEGSQLFGNVLFPREPQLTMQESKGFNQNQSQGCSNSKGIIDEDKDNGLKKGQGSKDDVDTQNKDVVDATPESSEIPDQDVDATAYAYFDKLWVSSKHHQSLLSTQWQCIMERVQQQGPELNTFKLTRTHVTGMLYFCKMLNTNFVVRFRAMELFNQFLKRFALHYTDYLINGTKEEKEEFERLFESQVFLRMCTCILIASKLHADNYIRAVTVEKVRDLLQAEGFKYSVKNIARSEMRVMEILDFRCLWVTPLELVEQLLGVLNLKLEFLKDAHYSCILLLEYCYSDMENIRKKFTSVKNLRKLKGSNDAITLTLQCASIIAAALCCISTDSKSNDYKKVAKIADVDEEDVKILSDLLLELILITEG